MVAGWLYVCMCALYLCTRRSLVPNRVKTHFQKVKYRSNLTGFPKTCEMTSIVIFIWSPVLERGMKVDGGEYKKAASIM